jgi:hypothetical protein
MGTRSLTIFKEDDADIVVMYRQYDGYPSGYGQELAGFLAGMMMVNGLPPDAPKKIANGMSCLAAQIIAHFKEEPGGIYLHAAGTRDYGEDYRYYVTGMEGKEPTIQVHEVSGGWGAKPTSETLLFEGTATEVLAWAYKQE